VVERVELKIDGMYRVQDSLHHRGSMSYISTVSTSTESAADWSDDRCVRGDAAECCSASEISI
jgi:hypothetical protein